MEEVLEGLQREWVFVQEVEDSYKIGDRGVGELKAEGVVRQRIF